MAERQSRGRWRGKWGAGLLLSTGLVLAMADGPEIPRVTFQDVAASAGLTHQTIYGGEETNRYLLETTGCGVAWIDYDHDGWLDLFFVNGRRLEDPRTGKQEESALTSRLYHNQQDGTFADVTRRAGISGTGWGQGVCTGDYNNDGHDDLFVTYYGNNVLWHNNGDGTFTDRAVSAGVAGAAGGAQRPAGAGRGSKEERPPRWGSGCAFVDYDRDGKLDLFVANYIDVDLKDAPTPEGGPCLYKGLMVACGPPGLQGAKNILYHNEGGGRFLDVSEKAGILETSGTYGLGVLTSDFDNDGWTDIYVANDSAPATLYRNNRNGTFTDIAPEAGAAYSGDGKPQAGMGVAAADFDGDGWLDIFKTNFSGDTSTLYRNLGTQLGGLVFDDVTFASGIGVNTRWLGWGCGFPDIDNDGWRDILLVNGHVYPEVNRLKSEAGYAQRKVLYQNMRNGTFRDITEQIGGPLLEPSAARGAAFGDYDNDGDLDIVINTVNGRPVLLRNDVSSGHRWVSVQLEGSRSNRSGLGARVRLVADGRTQIDDTRSGGSYYSQNDHRLHFGVGGEEKVSSLEVVWPSGTRDRLTNLPANQLIRIREGMTLGRENP